MSTTSNCSTSSAKFQQSRLPHDSPRTNETPPLSLSRFPPELKSMILASIASLDKPHLIPMMCTSQSMYDHFVPILYNRLDIDEKNAKKVFYGIIPYQIPGTTRFIPQPEEGEDVDFAIISLDKINSHKRKIWLLQQVKHLVHRDETAVQQVALGLYFTKLASIEWYRPHIQLKETQVFSQLHTLILHSACIASLSSGYFSQRFANHKQLIEATRNSLDAQQVCVISQDTLNSGIWSRNTLVPLMLDKKSPGELLTIHQGYYNRDLVIASGYTKTQIQLKACHCSICFQPDSIDSSQSVCPFTALNLVEVVGHDIERTNTYKKLKWLLDFRNVPRCLFQTEWHTIEGDIRALLASKRMAISAVRLERALAAWQKRF